MKRLRKIAAFVGGTLVFLPLAIALALGVAYDWVRYRTIPRIAPRKLRRWSRRRDTD